MDLYSRLGSSFVFCFAILQVQLGRTHLIVHIDVSGDYVVKTGISEYTVSTYYSRSVVIKCSSRPPFSSHLVLSKNNQPITEGVNDFADGIIFEKYYYGRSIVEKYHCASSITKGTFNDSYAHFTVGSEVEIRTVKDSILCASSVGRLGYVGESSTLQCMTVFSSYRCYFGRQHLRNEAPQLKLLVEDLSDTSCRCENQVYYRPCSLQSISVVESVIVNIFNTGNMTQADPSFAEFVCTSYPPRLMFWAVFGDGILFDFNHLNLTAFKVNTTVNITQVPGNTTLRISESVRGGNGIHTVICSTIDTEARVVAIHRIQHQLVKTLDCDLSSVKPTQMQVTTASTSYNPTSIGEDSTFEITTTKALKDSKDNEMNPTDQGRGMKRDAANDYFLMGVVGLPLLCTNFILIVAVCYLHKKTRYKAGIKVQASTPGTVSPDIELHDNPTYLAFNETEDTLCNEKEKMECTYANM